MSNPTQINLNKCIWMDAEVIDYHICTIGYKCDTCEMHHRITNPEPSSFENSPTIPINIEDPQSDSFQPGLQYYRNHIWIKHISKHLVYVGIDNIIFNLWEKISQLLTRKNHSVIKNNTSFCWFVLPNALVNLQLPFPGMVMQINPLIQKDIFDFDTFRTLPFTQRWIIGIDPLNGELNQDGWLTKQQYVQELVKSTKYVHSFIESSEDVVLMHTFDHNRKTIVVPIARVKHLIKQLSKSTHQIY